MRFVDTNVILRFMMDDHPAYSPRAYEFFKRVEAGQATAITNDAVITEIAHVLASSRSFALERPKIISILRQILEIPNLTIRNRGELESAITCYESHNIDFVDCLNYAQMRRRGIAEIVSFDHDFDNLPGITRVEP